jgi:hypothetical protein
MYQTHIYYIKNSLRELLERTEHQYNEVQISKPCYNDMLMSCCKKAGQKHRIKIANRSFEDVAKLNIWKQR